MSNRPGYVLYDSIFRPFINLIMKRILLSVWGLCVCAWELTWYFRLLALTLEKEANSRQKNMPCQMVYIIYLLIIFYRKLLVFVQLVVFCSLCQSLFMFWESVGLCERLVCFYLHHRYLLPYTDILVDGWGCCVGVAHYLLFLFCWCCVGKVEAVVLLQAHWCCCVQLDTSPACASCWHVSMSLLCLSSSGRLLANAPQAHKLWPNLILTLHQLTL